MEILYSSCKDSLEIITQHQDVLKVGQKINEQIQYMRHEKTFNKRILGIVVSMTICICIILLWLRRRHCIREHKLLVRENILHEECVRQKEQLEQNRVEIAAMQDKINQQNINEEQKQILMAELDSLHEQHADMVKKVRKYSEVIQKIESILTLYKEKKVPKVLLDEDDWVRLLAEVDKKGTVNRISEMFGLSEMECHLCCLLLLDYSVTDMGRIIQRDRVSVYRIERSILKKMGKEYQAGALQNLLRGMLNDYTIG